MELVLVEGRLWRGRQGFGAAGRRGVVEELVLEGRVPAMGSGLQGGGACRSGGGGVLLAALGARAGSWYSGAPIVQIGVPTFLPIPEMFGHKRV